MKYKVGDTVVIVKNASGADWVAGMLCNLGKTFKIIKAYEHTEFCMKYILDTTENWSYYSHMIDHEATAKLKLPQPHKSLLRSGMKVICKGDREYYTLVEIGSFIRKDRTSRNYFYEYNDDLNVVRSDALTDDIMQIWDGDTLIAQRTEKTANDIKKESLLSKIAELQAEVDRL